MKKRYDFSKGRRGPVLRTPGRKTRITIRIDDDVLEWFRTQVHAAGYWITHVETGNAIAPTDIDTVSSGHLYCTRRPASASR